MINKKAEKGITIVALIITVVILLILTGVTINSISNSNKIVPYNNMSADITLLEEKALSYYSKYKEVPRKESSRNIEGIQYYEIDLSKLENVTLNYGMKAKGDENDIYLINDNLKVYYLKGVEKSGNLCHMAEK